MKMFLYLIIVLGFLIILFTILNGVSGEVQEIGLLTAFMGLIIGYSIREAFSRR